MSDYEIKREWAPHYLVRRFFEQDGVWINSDGKELAVDTLPVPYALNVLLFLERVRAEVEPFLNYELHSTPLYKALKTRSLQGEGAPYFDDRTQTMRTPDDSVAARAAALRATQVTA